MIVLFADLTAEMIVAVGGVLSGVGAIVIGILKSRYEARQKAKESESEVRRKDSQEIGDEYRKIISSQGRRINNLEDNQDKMILEHSKIRAEHEECEKDRARQRLELETQKSRIDQLERETSQLKKTVNGAAPQ